MVTTRIKRLWIPKRINGKWRWLVKVKITGQNRTIVVDGKTTLFTIKEYKLLKGDD